MKNKNYHPIFSDAPSYMGGVYLMQSIKTKMMRNASVKKVATNQAPPYQEKGLQRVESMNNFRNNLEVSKLPKIKVSKNAGVAHHRDYHSKERKTKD